MNILKGTGRRRAQDEGLGAGDEQPYVPAPKEIRLLATIGVVAAAGGCTLVLGLQALQGDANAIGQVSTLATLGMGALIGVMAAKSHDS